MGSQTQGTTVTPLQRAATANQKGALLAGHAQRRREGDEGTGGGAPRHLPCRRAPFLLKKVLPGQMGGPDVLQENTDVCEALRVGFHSLPAALSLAPPSPPSLGVALKRFPKCASKTIRLKTGFLFPMAKPSVRVFWLSSWLGSHLAIEIIYRQLANALGVLI